MMIKIIMTAIVFTTFTSTVTAADSYPWLITMDPTSDSRNSGEKLMNLTYGLKLLENENKKENTLLVGVHGSNSQGYEWIYPLKTLDSNNHLTFFYRWDDSKCPQPSAKKLSQALNKVIDEHSSIKKIIILGHSYGGLLASWFAENWTSSLSIEIHTIASPLIGNKIINNLCEYIPPNSIKKNVAFFQWRTQKELDGAFKDLEINPQAINLKGSKVYELPDLYKGNRLGHNWSISFVADELKKRIKKNDD